MCNTFGTALGIELKLSSTVTGRKKRGLGSSNSNLVFVVVVERANLIFPLIHS